MFNPLSQKILLSSDNNKSEWEYCLALTACIEGDRKGKDDADNFLIHFPRLRVVYNNGGIHSRDGSSQTGFPSDDTCQIVSRTS